MRLAKIFTTEEPTFDYEAENRFFATRIEDAPNLPWLIDDLRLWVPQPHAAFNGKRVLEIGSSEGALARTVVENFEPEMYVALDIIQRRLIGTERLRPRHSNLYAVTGSAFALPIGDCKFDVILNNGTLNHLPHIDVAACEFARVLRPGGVYFGREPNGYNPAVRWISTRSKAASPNTVPVLERKVKKSFENAGFEVFTDFFWRRLPMLKYRFLAVSLRIQATKRPSIADS
ncbi:MAG: hypothetical protein C4318_04865 [Acidimicrobiia bacterium]